MLKKLKSSGLLKEPLVHFLLIGAIVFGLHSLWSARRVEADRTITISAAQVQRLSAIWAGEAGRDPTAQDVQRLLADYVQEEALYREALRLGLDRDDTIIRRRLAQKMGFVMTREGPDAPLSEADLRTAYEENPQTYARPPRLSFTHVPFNFAAPGESREADMAAALETLSRAETLADPARLGDPFLLSRVHIGLSETETARLFGQAFAAQLFSLEGEGWSGPHRSRLAWHLIKIDDRIDGGLPPFEEVIETVRTREIERRRRAANEAEMSKLLERYTVIINTDPA